MRFMPLCALVLLFGCSSNGTRGAGQDAAAPHDGGTVTVTGDTVTLSMTPFFVDKGQEVFMCQTFANPFSGQDAEIIKFQSSMSAGSHHMLLLYEDGAVNGGLETCSGLTFGPMPYGAQQPEAQVSFPSGIASLVKSTQGFRVVAHYLNATQAGIMAHVTITLSKATPGTIQQHAGVFFLNNVKALLPMSGGGIPAHTRKTITATYTTTKPINLIYAVAHMHQRSLSMTATYGPATPLYQTDSWDNPPYAEYAPPVALPAGTPISWSCDINNDTDQPLIFGESAMTNQMCIFNGQYYPADDASPSIISTQ